MTLQQLKDWVNSLPEEFLNFNVVNGETAYLHEAITYRIDRPVTALTVDEDTKEIVIMCDEYADPEINPSDAKPE